MVQLQTINWPQGQLTAVWTDAGLCRLTFGPAEIVDAQAMSTSQLKQAGPRALALALEEYFNHEGELDFPLEHLDWTGVPEFHRLVLERCAKIGRGEFMTYGELAAAAGSPNAARAVGQVMARNRWPLIVPCHRVVGHSGKLTGYSGQGGLDTKLWLLNQEGLVSFRSAKGTNNQLKPNQLKLKQLTTQ